MKLCSWVVCKGSGLEKIWLRWLGSALAATSIRPSLVRAAYSRAQPHAAVEIFNPWPLAKLTIARALGIEQVTEEQDRAAK